MGRRSHCNISSLLLLLFSVLISKGSSYLVTVHVKNDIGDGIVLDARCRSDDYELGQRMLRQGEEWNWKFRAITGYSYFWCYFRWYDDQERIWYSGNFDVYHANGLLNKYIEKCRHNCMWSANRQGFFLYRVDRQEWQQRDEWTIDSIGKII
ncbi:hypothetical protein MKW98_023034 [Papaver atlanticum]|uniref:S-protein homolog n=1 Tax=Papaver atlanticum TaxID=357466 RepID=A0AAD4XUB7_9MAGN|nr:hypothetical protein MKW98_023034 [Papaver atlanticum]